MIGGEGEENPIWMTNGAWIENAQKFVIFLKFENESFQSLKNIL
jgi:hypothetical protein